MRNDVTLKLAASGLLIGLTVVGCSPFGGLRGPSTVSSQAPKASQQAAELYAKAAAKVRKGEFAEALPLAERAVELSPRDVAYRMVLADLYVKNGRFRSAEATYADVLSLNPGNHRAALSRALAQVAMGDKAAALSSLERLATDAPASDIGLAFALAGDPQRAIALLEPAARANGADGRVRQNLALAYALAGDWQKAHATAAQDVSPAELRTRMQQWAVFAQPKTSYDQVASLLGVTPAQDPGQPMQLALANSAAQPVALAENTVTPEAPMSAAVETAAVPTSMPPPVETAAIEETPAAPPLVQTVTVEAPAPAAAEPVVPVEYAAAAQTLVTPEPAVIAAPAVPYKTPIRAFEPAKPAAQPRASLAASRPSVAPSRFVVQIGAYRDQIAIDRAWSEAQRRYGLGGEERALTTTINMPGKGLLHRLSVSGFATRGDATRLCEAIQAKGGSCFVRTTAGDAPVQWAALRERARNA